LLRFSSLPLRSSTFFCWFDPSGLLSRWPTEIDWRFVQFLWASIVHDQHRWNQGYDLQCVEVCSIGLPFLLLGGGDWDHYNSHIWRSSSWDLISAWGMSSSLDSTREMAPLHWLGDYFHNHFQGISSKMHLLDMIIRPTVLYGSEI
jgi:hypothetical protein